MVNLLILYIHADKTAGGGIHPYVSSSVFPGIKDRQGVTVRIYYLHLSVHQIRRHFFTAHLVKEIRTVLHHA